MHRGHACLHPIPAEGFDVARAVGRYSDYGRLLREPFPSLRELFEPAQEVRGTIGAAPRLAVDFLGRVVPVSQQDGRVSYARHMLERSVTE